jgi:hypothetical protein
VSVVALLVACSAPAGGAQDWRDLEVVVPDGWEVFERRDDLLSMADGPLGEEAGDPGERVVAAQFRYEPTTSADDWRDLVLDTEGVIEVDEATEIGGLPARRIVFAWTTNGVDTREMVVLVPSRQLVMLFQPVPVRGQTDAPEVFLANRADFEAILDSVTFGAPVDTG